MSPRLRRARELVLGSFWALPSLLMAVCLALGLVLPVVERTTGMGDWARQLTWGGFLLEATPGGSREVLAASVAALATILAIAFSMTMVTLQLAASQYTSRLLRRFMADRATQQVLGTYVGTIVYLLLVLRAVRAADEKGGEFVPFLSLALGFVLTVLCLALLPYFLHHVSRSIQAATIIHEVRKATLRALGRQEEELRRHREEAHRLEQERGALEARIRAHPKAPPCMVACEETGYLQVLDMDRLRRGLLEGTERVRIHAAPGDFFFPGLPLLSLWPPRPLSERQRRRLQRAFTFGPERTLAQDASFGIRQLVDMALKALSPGINEVTTALMVVNALGAVARALAAHEPLEDGWGAREVDGTRVEVPDRGLVSYLEDMFGELPRAAASHPRVLARLLEVLAELATLQEVPKRREVLLRFGQHVLEGLEMAPLLPAERQLLEGRLLALRERTLRWFPDAVVPLHTH